MTNSPELSPPISINSPEPLPPEPPPLPNPPENPGNRHTGTRNPELTINQIYQKPHDDQLLNNSTGMTQKEKVSKYNGSYVE